MKKIIATTLAFIGAAYAATVEGVVQSVDPVTRTITLQDGTSVTASEAVSAEVLASLAAGTKVQVTVEDGTTNATAIEVAQ